MPRSIHRHLSRPADSARGQGTTSAWVVLARTVLLAAVLALVVPAPAVGAERAPTADDSQGTPGPCPDADGVTVVVDFGELDGDVLVRCAPGDKDRNGLEALQDAGIAFDGVQGNGDSLACRIAERPAADESFEVDGRGYSETCTQMPPASAYWSYWTAENGGDWGFSQQGPASSSAVGGGFEGWSFTLNTKADEAAPRLDPVRPDGGETPPTEGTQNGVAWTGGADDADAPEDEASEDDGSGAAPAFAAGGAIVLLAVLIGVTAIRRRSRRST